MRRVIGGIAVVAAAAALVAGASSAGTASRSAKPLVVLSTDIGQLNDHGFNQLAYAGLERAIASLGIEGRVYQANSSQDYIPNMARAAQQGAALVIAVGFDQADAIATVAKKYPKTHFAIVDVDQTSLAGKPKNVEGIVFTEQQVGYLAGYLSGLLEKQRGGHAVIGSVGGEKQPPVDRYIAGYQAGAKAADPKVKLLNAYSQDWVAQDKCKNLALQQIASGANIVFQVAGGCGLGVLDAAKQKGVWGIGVDADQSYLGSQVLTSAMKRVDNSVFDTVKQVLAGKFTGGTNEVFSLKNDGVGLGKISTKVPAADVKAVDAVRRKIASGAIAGIPTRVP
ncbi:MAG: BMP family ABC transporter substrate-binding protein [Actinobacteria bacterium]|nr:BMP family ABC transporter substrate-binding protein [Actinomycetota bacterium]